MYEELEQIILKQFKKYPLMQIEDFIKLIYQNEFGGGHLIKDKKNSLKRLEEEYKENKNYNIECEIEDIGNSIVRVPLKMIPDLKMDIKSFNDIFVESSSIVVGNINNFIEKLKIFKDLTKKYNFNIEEKKLDKFLKTYIENGCPMISHSKIYKEAYKPSYRIVRSELLILK